MESKSVKHHTATYVPIPSGYLGQLLDWPEVATEGKTIEECRELLVDALHEMILAYRQLQKPIPEPKRITEQAPDETEMHTQLQFQSETVFANLWNNEGDEVWNEYL